MESGAAGAAPAARRTGPAGRRQPDAPKWARLLLGSKKPGAVQGVADGSGEHGGRDHFADRVNAHKGADEQENILPADEALYIVCISVKHDERSHEKERVQEGGKETCDEAARAGALCLPDKAENIAQQEAVQETGHKPLDKSQNGIDFKKNGAHGA